MAKRILARITVLIIACFLSSLIVFAQQAQPSPSPAPNITLARDPSQGFFKPYGSGFLVSTAVFGIGAGADIGSSRGLIELNPLYRNRNGSLNVGRNLIFTGAVYAGSLLFERKHPHLAFWYRVIIGGARIGMAIRNLHQ